MTSKLLFMELGIVNPDPRYAPPAFAPAPQTGYLHIAASVAPPTRTPFLRRDAGRDALLAQLRSLAADVAGLPEVVQVSVYRAILIPPIERAASHPARYDVAVLVETSSPQALERLTAMGAVQDTLAAIRAGARDVHVMAARCVRFLGPVDRRSQGLFLFNHFAGENPALATALWEHLAAWYVAETGLSNSTLLAPTGRSDYVLVNHACWDMSLLRLAVTQFAKPTFRSYLQANLRAHNVIAMPILYRLAWTSHPDPARRMP